MLLYVLVAFLVIALFVVGRLPHVYNVEQAVIIRKALVEVRDTVADLNFYPRWSPLKLLEGRTEHHIVGTPKTAGHSYSWRGKKAGKGNITLRALDERHLHFDLTIAGWKLKTKDNWFFEEWGDGETKVILQNYGKCTFPFARLFGRTIFKKINSRIRSGLTNLKILCETGSPAAAPTP